MSEHLVEFLLDQMLKSFWSRDWRLGGVTAFWAFADAAGTPVDVELAWTPPDGGTPVDDELAWTPPDCGTPVDDELAWIPPYGGTPVDDELAWTPPDGGTPVDDELAWTTPDGDWATVVEDFDMPTDGGGAAFCIFFKCFSVHTLYSSISTAKSQVACHLIVPLLNSPSLLIVFFIR